MVVAEVQAVSPVATVEDKLRAEAHVVHHRAELLHHAVATMVVATDQVVI